MLAAAVLLSGWTARRLPLFSTRCFLLYDKFFDAVPLKVSSQDRLLVKMFTFITHLKKKIHISSLTRNDFAECAPSRTFRVFPSLGKLGNLSTDDGDARDDA